MKTLLGTAGKGNNKKVKLKTNSNRARLPDGYRKVKTSFKWQDEDVIAWKPLKFADILTLSEEELKKIRESTPLVNVYEDGLLWRGTEFSGFLMGIDTKTQELKIQLLGMDPKKPTITRVPIKPNIILELPVTEEK